MSGSRIEGADHIIESLEDLIDMQKLEQTMGKACAIVESSKRYWRIKT